MKTPGFADVVPPLFTGAFVAIYLQSVTGWWLNSGRGVAYTCGALLALAVVFGSVRAGAAFPARLVALWVGAQLSLGAYLFFHEGGSTIFPIVLVGGAILSGAAVAAGGGIGWLFAGLTTRRSG